MEEAALEEDLLRAAGQETSSEQKNHREPARVYVKKAQRYEDLQSSSSAFLLVGSIMLASGVLFWLGVIPMPIAGFSGIITKTLLVVMGAAALYVAFTSSKDARKLSGQIAQEEETTKPVSYTHLIYAFCYLICYGLYLRVCISHGNSSSGKFQHIHVILSITKCHNFLLTYRTILQKTPDSRNLPAFFRNHIHSPFMPPDHAALV